jgi:GT2 family glycosyltransferase
MPERVSVFVFTCDRPDDLRRCLESVRKQRFRDFELTVVDNGNNAATNLILKEYNAKVIKDRTKRLSYLFNLGWKNSVCSFIAYLADDVEIEPSWLEQGLRSFERHSEAAVVTGPLVSPFEFTGEMHALYTTANKSAILRLFSRFYESFILEGKAFQPCVLCESGSYTLGQGFKPDFRKEREVDLATTSSMIIRRSAIESVKGFDENFMFNHADGDLFIRLKKQGYSIIYNPGMRAIHYVRIGPSRYPYYIGRDTAYFYMKDIRPKTLRGIIAAAMNIFILNGYWIYKAINTKDIKQIRGLFGFLRGIIDYIIYNA